MLNKDDAKRNISEQHILHTTKCLACGGNNLDEIQTKVSGFISEKVFGITDEKEIPVILYHCKNCGFAFFNYRFSDSDCKKLYSGYRNEEYQKLRQKYDIWYTKEINDAIGKSKIEVTNRKKYLTSILGRYVTDNVSSILDYGGDKGQFFTDLFRDSNKYVYEISDAKPVDGVILLSNYEEVKKYEYNFVMCNHVLEHVSDLDYDIGLIKAIGNVDTLYYFEVPFDSPFYKSKFNNIQFLLNPYFTLPIIFKHYLNVKKNKAFNPMSEHINYFTADSLRKLLERTGFEVIEVVNGSVDCGWQKTKILSAVCKIKSF